jgi:hypothetical protein
MTEKEIAAAQAWQGFRERCVDLAVRSGAQDDKIVEIAAKIAAYIITKSAQEIPAKSEGVSTVEGNRDGRS